MADDRDHSSGIASSGDQNCECLSLQAAHPLVVVE